MRKIPIDEIVKYIPPTNSSPSEISHDHKPKNVSNPGKQNKKFSRNNKNIIKDIKTAEEFKILEWIMNCYFWLKNIQIR